jgi:hypothetical protein
VHLAFDLEVGSIALTSSAAAACILRADAAPAEVSEARVRQERDLRLDAEAAGISPPRSSAISRDLVGGVGSALS